MLDFAPRTVMPFHIVLYIIASSPQDRGLYPQEIYAVAHTHYTKCTKQVVYRHIQVWKDRQWIERTPTRSYILTEIGRSNMQKHVEALGGWPKWLEKLNHLQPSF